MPDFPQIQRLVLSRLPQVDTCDLDFTDRATGEPLDRVCLTGPCGIGKSAILSRLQQSATLAGDSAGTEPGAGGLVLTKFRIGERSLYQARGERAAPPTDGAAWFTGDIEQSDKWPSLFEDPPGHESFLARFSEHRVDPGESPATAESLSLLFGPEDSLVNGEPAGDFRDFLETSQRERTADLLDFLRHPDNRKRTVGKLEEEFEEAHPFLLDAAGALWDSVLAERFLRFHPRSETFFTCSRSGEEIPLSALNGGLARSLHQTALFFALVAGRPDCRFHLFLDEPERGTDDALAAKASGFYQSRIRSGSGQLFVATHNPVVISGFAPEEVFQLEFDEDAGVSVERCEPEPLEEASPEVFEEEAPGEPAGPADASRSRFAELRRAIRETDDQDELADLLEEMMSLRKL